MPTPAPRSKRKESRPVRPVKIIPSLQEMNEFEKEEMKKSRPVVKSKLSKLHKWLDNHVPKPIKNAFDEAFLRLKNSILGLYDGAKKTLKNIVEKVVEEEQGQEEDIDLTLHEHERALKGACRSFVMAGLPKTDIDSYFDQNERYIKTLIENQLKEMGSVKIIMTLWVVWKKPIKLLIKLPEDAKNAQELDDGTTDDIYYEKIEMPFNSLMTEFFDASDINDLIECMLAYIKAQTENPKFSESGLR